MAFELPDIFGKKANPELDKFEKKLNELKETMSTNSGEAMGKLKTSFMEDMAELGLADDKKEELWEKAQKDIEAKLLGKTPEAKALSAFVDNVENYPIIKEAINSEKPLAKVKGKLKEHGLLTVATFGLEAWVKEALKKDPNSWIAKGLQKILDFFKAEDEEKSPSAKEETGGSQPETAENAETKMAENLNKKLAELDWKIEAVTVDHIKANNQLANQVEVATASGSKLKVLIEGLKAKGDALKDFELLVNDLNLKNDQLDQIVRVTNGSDETYQLPELNPANLREFIGQYSTNDPNKIDAKFKKAMPNGRQKNPSK